MKTENIGYGLSIRIRQLKKPKISFIILGLILSACGGGGGDDSVNNTPSELSGFSSYDDIATYAKNVGINIWCTVCQEKYLESEKWKGWSKNGVPVRSGEYTAYPQNAYPIPNAKVLLKEPNIGNRLQIITIDLTNGAESTGYSQVFIAPSNDLYPAFYDNGEPVYDGNGIQIYGWPINILTEEVITLNDEPIYRAIRQLGGRLLSSGNPIATGVWPEYCDPGSSFQGNMQLHIVERFDDVLSPPLGKVLDYELYMTRYDFDAICGVVTTDLAN